MTQTTKSPSRYMGGPVQVETGPRGAIAEASYIAHSHQFGRKLHKVGEGVWCHVGSCLGNSTMIEGENGLIIVDTGDCVEQSQQQNEDFRKVSSKPVSALLYTHSHYALGSRTYIPLGEDGKTPVWAHKALMTNLARTVGDLVPFLTRRVAIQFGMFLPRDGEDSLPNQGLGPFFFELDKYKPTSGFVRPTNDIEDGQEATIDGVRFKFFHAEGDTDDTLLIWMPDRKTVINNIAWPVMFNIYTLRGEMFRNPVKLLRGLDLMLELEPEHMIGVHGLPISGKDAIKQAVTEYRDCIQFTYDQTVRGINAGLSPAELVEFVKLPPALANGRLTGQFYGELPFYVRQIYAGLVGWFGVDTVELHPVAPADEAARLINLAGGAEKMFEAAEKSLVAREYSWAAQLATYLLRLSPNEARYKTLKAKALRAMGQVTTASNTRSWYLTQARELEGSVDTRQLPIRFANEAMVKQMPPLTYVNALRFKIAPELSAAGAKLVRLALGGAGTFDLHLRHGVVEVRQPTPGSTADCQIELGFDDWAKMNGGAKASVDLAAIKISGDANLGRRIVDAI
ncbi:MAG: MBL fold metallo-hydrolase [Hyphomicrobiales bacterium]|nr:MBL fold metallo-hydrolase [Hyphomicrobiales bacterium]